MRTARIATALLLAALTAVAPGRAAEPITVGFSMALTRGLAVVGKSGFVGEVAFGAEGEWTQPRPIWLQYQHVQGNALDQFKSAKTVVILAPAELKSGDLIYPYTAAKE